MKESIDDIVSRFEREIPFDYVGLWQVVSAAERNESEDARAFTILIVREMLSRGFRAGYLADAGGFDPFQDQEPASIIRRIEEEWDELGHAPSIGDGFWFNKD